ncbi:MAG: triose-phosphate isomerase [Acidobacteriota bacterium]
MSRRSIVAANWKMHKVRAEASSFCQTMRTDLGAPAAEVLLFPSFPLLDTVVATLGDAAVAVGGQDVHGEAAGAHTGDVSVAQLLDAGCRWVVCGHSERRANHDETSAQVGAKAKIAAAHGLLPLVCVGETGDQRSAGETEKVLAEQLAGLLDAGPERFELAYEPVWAIGTGLTATPEMAQATQAWLRAELGRQLAARGHAQTAEATRILYGGSVKPHNAGELIAASDIDGFLVGGASLDVASFLAIIAACES